jgi:hypothetical protein
MSQGFSVVGVSIEEYPIPIPRRAFEEFSLNIRTPVVVSNYLSEQARENKQCLARLAMGSEPAAENAYT